MGRMDAGFFKRGKTYQIRRFVPADLQLFLDRKEILKSLRTGDEAEAIRRYRVEATKIDDYFEQQRQLMGMARRHRSPAMLSRLQRQGQPKEYEQPRVS